jgi:DNA-binding PadR family transcriptional regulator
MRITETEREVLELLAEHGQMYGADLRDASAQLRGPFKALYVTLGAMEERKLIQGHEVPPFSRRVFSITGIGRRALMEVA